MVTIIPYSDHWRSSYLLLQKRCFQATKPHHDPELSLDTKLAQDGLIRLLLDGQELQGSVMGGWDGHRGWVYSLAVSPDSRRRGFGSRLLQHVVAELKALGALKINLQVTQANASLLAFYQANGFTIEDHFSLGIKTY
jgi:ribosomal protein S18 acetylase RimI-like enzyme